MNLPVVGTIHRKSNKFVMGVTIKVTGESKLNDSPAGFPVIQCRTSGWTSNQKVLGTTPTLNNSMEFILQVQL